jgi:hypothetical protein
VVVVGIAAGIVAYHSAHKQPEAVDASALPTAPETSLDPPTTTSVPVDTTPKAPPTPVEQRLCDVVRVPNESVTRALTLFVAGGPLGQPFGVTFAQHLTAAAKAVGGDGALAAEAQVVLTAVQASLPTPSSDFDPTPMTTDAVNAAATELDAWASAHCSAPG